MQSRGCGAGCAATIGALFLSVAFDLLLEAALGPGLFSLGLGAIFMLAAYYQLRGLKDLAAAANAAARRERLVLAVAAQHHGLVTPAMIVMESRELTIAAARQLLDSLATEQLCQPETDSQGNLCYRFALGHDAPERELSPDAWVEAMSAKRRRLTGSEPTSSAGDVDATL